MVFLKIVEKDLYNFHLSKPMHKAEHRVIYADTDAGGVVYYANYFRWFEAGRREILRGLGIDYKALHNKGILVPVVEAHCNYYKPARYDDIVAVETRIIEIKDKTIKFENKVFRKDNNELLVEGYTINIFIDSKKMKSMEIPKYVRVKLKIG